MQENVSKQPVKLAKVIKVGVIGLQVDVMGLSGDRCEGLSPGTCTTGLWLSAVCRLPGFSFWKAWCMKDLLNNLSDFPLCSQLPIFDPLKLLPRVQSVVAAMLTIIGARPYRLPRWCDPGPRRVHGRHFPFDHP